MTPPLLTYCDTNLYHLIHYWIALEHHFHNLQKITCKKYHAGKQMIPFFNANCIVQGEGFSIDILLLEEDLIGHFKLFLVA